MKDTILARMYAALTLKPRLERRSRPDSLRQAFIERLRTFGFRGKSYQAAKKFYQQLRRQA